MSDFLEQRIAERQRRVDEIFREIDGLERELVGVQAELRAYQDVLAHMRGEGTRPATEEPTPSAEHIVPSALEAGALSASSVSSRMSPTWRHLLIYMARRYPESVTNDELRAEAERLGSPIQSENLRSSLWNHVRRNWLERIENGVYRITRDGAAAAGVQIQPFSATGQSEPGREHVFQ